MVELIDASRAYIARLWRMEECFAPSRVAPFALSRLLAGRRNMVWRWRAIAASLEAAA